MTSRSRRVRCCSAALAGCVAGMLAGAPSPAAALSTAPVSALSATSAAALLAQASMYKGLGFDACTAPSPAAMTAWWNSTNYAAAGIYIGGLNRACGDGYLSASWVKSVSRIGWKLIPTYVGRQAPCLTKSHLQLIDAKTVAAQGVAAADDAVSHAAALGLVKGSAIYLDLESYPRNNAACTTGVLKYESAWTSRLHARGYLSGFYSSAGSGITDLARSKMAGLVRPDALWIARWDNKASASDPALSPLVWCHHQRLKQYAGGHTETHGGVKLNIDNNYLDGPVARVG
ncbi:MAG: glycoside hydrolase domain-containing protein [Actinocrinis sp.]